MIKLINLWTNKERHKAFQLFSVGPRQVWNRVCCATHSGAPPIAALYPTQMECSEVWQISSKFSQSKTVGVYLCDFNDDLVSEVVLGFNKDSFMAALCENSGTSDSLLDT